LYTRVESKFWQDEKMRAVTDDARYLMLYLLTSPHRNILGFYFLPFPYACFDLGWDEKRFKKALEELLNTGGIAYDAISHVVLVKNYLKHNPLENPNQVKSAIVKLDELPETHLFQSFLTIIKQSDKPFMQPLIERLQERLGQPGTETGTESVTEDKDICASEAAQESKCTPEGDGVEALDEVAATLDEQKAKSRPRSPFTNKRQEQFFDEFWERYPKKRSKGRAERAWVKIKPDEQLFKAILDGLERAKTSVEWLKDDGQYIPYPSSWLNAKGWEDEYKTTAEVNNDAKHQRYTSGPSAFGNTKPQSNRFAGLVRDGGTGRIAGQEDSPNTGGDSTAPRNFEEGPSGDKGYQVTEGMSMAR